MERLYSHVDQALLHDMYASVLRGREGGSPSEAHSHSSLQRQFSGGNDQKVDDSGS